MTLYYSMKIGMFLEPVERIARYFSRMAMATLLLTGVSFSAQALTLCYDDTEQYPWVLKNGKGLRIVLLEKVAVAAREKMDFLAMPWKNCLASVETGEVAGAFAASYSEERAKYAVYPMADGKPDRSRRMHIDGYTLLRLKDSRIGWNGSKFSNLTGPIGTQSAYSIATDLVRWGAKVDSNSDGTETLLRRFGARQLSAIALMTGEAKYVLKKPYLADKVEIVSPPLTEKPYFLIFGRGYYDKNRKTVDEIWSMIAKVRESPEYKALESADPLSR